MIGSNFFNETYFPYPTTSHLLVFDNNTKKVHNKSLTLDSHNNHPPHSHSHFQQNQYQNSNITTSKHVVQPNQEQETQINKPSKKRTYLHSSTEHANKMERKNSTNTPQRTSTLGMNLGEIVEVQGGHIVRSTGRKDRHSKVCTAKGPRDRRVRLAAHTAIQFYDVQDRLGYDRPSKAVDWLIKKAKNAIDELAELPPWNPIITCSGATNATTLQAQDDNGKEQNQLNELLIENEEHGLHQNCQDSSFLPPSLDSDTIADTIKSFFPVGANNSSSMQQFQSLPNQDLLQNRGQSQDLSLSLHSFPDHVMLHHQTEQQPVSHAMLTGSPFGLHENAGGWHEQFQAAEFSRFHRLGALNAETSNGYMFNVPQQLFSNNQRGPLQSNNTPFFRAWMDPVIANAMTDHINAGQIQNQQQHHPLVMPMYPSLLSGIGISSGAGGFNGFQMPTRIQGDEEEHDGFSDKLSSASSDSRH